MSHIPEGFMQNALGHLVPVDQIRDADLLRDRTVRDLAAAAIELNRALSAFKTRALADITDLVRIAGERYGIELGGKKGNLQVSSYDGRYKVTRQVAERIAFTEELEAAKALVNACITRWSQGADPHIRVLVDRAFKTDGNGQVKTAYVLDLMRVDIDDAQWRLAMDAIRDSIQSAGSATYVRVYERVGQSDQYRAIPLDIASVVEVES
jgi:hypothetical protein